MALLLISARLLAAEPLRIAAASSLHPLLTQLATDNIQIISAASGVLHAQITQGARYDLFLTADPKYIHNLVERQRVSDRHRRCLGLSSLAVTTAPGSAPDLQMLVSRRTGTARLVIADPTLAPFGAAAMDVLDHQGVLSAWAPRLIRARSAAQAAQILVTGNADIALLPTTLAAAHGLPHVPVSAAWHRPVGYWAAILDREEASTAFTTRLQSLLLATPGIRPCPAPDAPGQS